MTTTPAPVPPIALGAMLFGTRLDEDRSFALLDAYVAAGGGWIDTADCYAFWEHDSGHGGQSEALLGRWLAARPGVRERVRLSTKVGCEPLWPGSFPERTTGLGADVVRRVARQSLERMGVDHLDLLWAHRDDRATPLDEIVAGFGGLVADGTVARWGFSNTALWRVERAAGLADAAGLARPTALQLRYSYLQPRPMVRGRLHDHRFGWVTDEVLDYAASDPEVAVWAYSPLLSGAYDRADRAPAEGYDHPGTTRRRAVLAEVADEVGASRSEVVLAWLVAGTPQVVPVAGVSTPAQLDAALAGVRLVLTADQRERLDAAW
ncbi:aldo/keto reductase [Cellulomonas triticagri]|uniref:Aldo/keto reductase n=1 Tax=Cellulomonas triticagri TaxID=2483352 RepID=A0A3M2JKC9_9CELL|nr:aldo/keto reductase [Cellulomonas triticagri]RMI12611.1 aldo/keto reductase [Cellulomonas triticagri]